MNPSLTRARKRTLAATAVVAVLGCAALVQGTRAVAAPHATGTLAAVVQPHTEGHVTGDAWVRYSVDPQNPLRRFTFDAHGNPYKIENGQIVFGAAHGSVKIDHPEPMPDGSIKHHKGSVKVDYVMATGPVAVVSGVVDGGVDFPKGERMSFSVYDDPRGKKFDRMGFSWGVVDGRCHRMGMAPAPFTSYASGRGYQVKDAPLPYATGDVKPPADPPPCTPGKS
ncbi:hypothetical protein [Luteipulveratus mongoliensis]|uniref:hypothetical protein n=1 Tax=Luteipulveratus mongoliensis TaxID=571913 RepID=UPI000695F6BF|nr:hypothetical protein [Luteipulveratus mongoliensis]